MNHRHLENLIMNSYLLDCYRNLMLGFVNSPQPTALIVTISLLVSCRPSCGDSPEFNTYNCDKNKGPDFSACIKKNFPIGSIYSDLDKYLSNLCLTEAKLPESYGKYSFNFRWESDSFPPTPYGVVVSGHYDAQQKITDIGFFPDPSGSDIKPVTESQKPDKVRQ
jgi:hypothetical protein